VLRGAVVVRPGRVADGGGAIVVVSMGVAVRVAVAGDVSDTEVDESPDPAASLSPQPDMRAADVRSATAQEATPTGE
jgi:hypothetical protein